MKIFPAKLRYNQVFVIAGYVINSDYCISSQFTYKLYLFNCALVTPRLSPIMATPNESANPKTRIQQAKRAIELRPKFFVTALAIGSVE
jgi:hypothetical protein